MQRGYTDGPYGQIHYSDTGSGIPLVLCHQAPMSQRQYEKAYPLLHAKGIRAIGFDLPGYGMSDPPGFVPRIEDYAKIYPSLLSHLGLSQAHCLGHHTGAQVVTAIALAYPDEVLSLILNGPLPMTKDVRDALHSSIVENEKNFAPDASGDALLELFKIRTSFANDKTNWHDATRYVAETLMGLGPFWYGHNAAFNYDHGEALRKITQPTMVLTNTGDQIYDLAQDAMRLRPDFGYVALEGGGIDIVDEMPQLWAKAVAGFVLGQEAS